MRQKNAAFANNVRAGKNPTKPSRADIAAKRSPVGNTILGGVHNTVLMVVQGYGH